MNKLIITTLLLLWGSFSSARAAPIIFDFTGIVDSGNYSGTSFSGNVSYNSSSSNPVNYQVNLIGGTFIPQQYWGDSGFAPEAGTSNSGYSENGVSLSIFRDDFASETTMIVSPYLYSITSVTSLFSLDAIFSGSTPLMNGTGSISLYEDVAYDGCSSGIGNCSMMIYYNLTGVLTNISLRNSTAKPKPPVMLKSFTTVPEPSAILLMAVGIAGLGFFHKKQRNKFLPTAISIPLSKN